LPASQFNNPEAAFWASTFNTLHTQIAIGTDDVYKTAEVVKLFGGQVVREPGPLPGISTKITSILDPDGWKSVSGFLF
jgi:predicted enzyme related to lactoylglutathione lyase